MTKVAKLADVAIAQKVPRSRLGNLELQTIQPVTENQKLAFKLWDEGYNLILRGSPGTGKTFLAFYFALEMFLENPDFDEIVIIRSAVPSRDMGFMGGKRERDKLKEYERPYIRLAAKLLKRDDAWNVLLNKQFVRFLSTSFLRGDEFENAIVIVDEWQNMSAGELHTVLTRVGNNSKIILAGDEEQTDLHTRTELPCIPVINVLNTMTSIRQVHFKMTDIVRSGFVRDYLIARELYHANRTLRKMPELSLDVHRGEPDQGSNGQ